MIGWLSGILREKHPPLLLLDVRGVGYELEAPMTTFYDLPQVGESVSLYTHQVVREDAHQLYGFLNGRDRAVFRLLIRVNGVGPKLALAILSGMNAQSFEACVREGNTDALTRLPGIGKKTAERLVIEMRDRLGPGGNGEAPRTDPTGTPGGALGAEEEAVSALVALGYRPQEAAQRVKAVSAPGLACEELIRRSLQSMVR